VLKAAYCCSVRQEFFERDFVNLGKKKTANDYELRKK
jgi:hypothetical protein